LVLGLRCTVLVRSSSGSRHADGIAESVQMLDFLLGRVLIEAASFAPLITRDLTLRQTIEAQVHNMLVRLSNALAQTGRSLNAPRRRLADRPVDDAAAKLRNAFQRRQNGLGKELRAIRIERLCRTLNCGMLNSG
jgi:hypothetical protein